MKLIIGLGNAGEKYTRNRHNVGFMVMDALAAKITSNQFAKIERLDSSIIAVNQTVVLAKPQTSMNSSGAAVKKIIEQYNLKAASLWIIHDDLDIKLGAYKVQRGIGPRLHRGIGSIEEALGVDNFWRVRVGVDNRSGDNRVTGEVYVLEDFKKQELDILNKTIDRIVVELKLRISSS